MPPAISSCAVSHPLTPGHAGAAKADCPAQFVCALPPTLARKGRLRSRSCTTRSGGAVCPRPDVLQLPATRSSAANTISCAKSDSSPQQTLSETRRPPADSSLLSLVVPNATVKQSLPCVALYVVLASTLKALHSCSCPFVASAELDRFAYCFTSLCSLLRWVRQARAVLSRHGLHSAPAGILPAYHSLAWSHGTCGNQHAEAPVCPPARCARPPLNASEEGACDSLASTVVAGRDAGDAQADLLRWLKQVYEVTAWEAPCLDAVPLLEFAGWTDGAARVPAPAFAPISTYAS